MVLLSLSSSWIDSFKVFDSGMIDYGGDSAMTFFRFWSYMDANRASLSHNFPNHSHMLA
jgi:hypothetical protein